MTETGIHPRKFPQFVNESLKSINWPLSAGFVSIAIPAAALLANQTWSHEEGAHGPLVLGTAAWLLWRAWPKIESEGYPGNTFIAACAVAISLTCYTIGQALDFITLCALGVYGTGLAIFYAQFGGRVIIRNCFVFIYLLFAVPPPNIWITEVTSPLKQFVSMGAVGLLQPFGLPVSHEGVVIFVAQYQLLVEDACSGLNSIIGLLAIGLFYIYLARKITWWYSALLAALIIPIAIIANIFRIVILILLTYFAGDEVAQGFLHEGAGLAVFVIALSLIFFVDSVLGGLFSRKGQSPP